MKHAFTIVFIAVLGFFQFPVLAGVDVHEFASDAERDRFNALVRELRCPTCQNQTLSDSDATFAVDLRREVVRLINEGHNDEEIKQYMVNRYGDFILYRPPVQENTLLLWWLPVIMLALGLLIFIVTVMKRRRDATVAFETIENDEMSDIEEMIETGPANKK